MSSYQQNYDAQSYQVNPYQAPANEMVQAIATRQNYWDSAATSVKNAYQNYLNLDLTRQDNHEQLNQLMTGVNQQLKQVTQTDLSLGENYGKALSIFDPIIKNDNIMGDNAITRHYKDQFNVAQSYRIKDNGKSYSDTNVRDLSNHLQDFAADPNAANWRQHYSTRSFYTPYTDVAAEVRQVGKDFKPDTTSLTTPMYLDANGHPTTKGGGSPSGYMLNQTDKSIIASQYRAFLDAHLSDKAKDQLAIDGRVKYHGQIGALAQDYTAHNQEKINYYSNEIKDLNGKLAGATDAQKDAYRSQINNYDALVKELNLENTKMHAGDFSNLTPSKDQIAAQLYTNNYTDYVAKASAHKNIDIKYTPDQVWKTMYHEENENKRFNIAKDLQWDIANLNNDTKLAIAGMKGTKLKPGQSLLDGIPGYATSDKSSDETFGKTQYDKMRTDSQTEFSASVDQMNKKIASDKGIDPNDTKVPQTTRDAAVAAWMADPRNKADVAQYNAAAAKKGSEDQTFAAIEDDLNRTLNSKFPAYANYKQNTLSAVLQGQNVVLTPRGGGNSTTVTLTPEDVRQIAAGTSNKYKATSFKEYGSSFSGPGMGGNYTPSNIRTLTVNGKEYRYNYGVLDDTLNKLEEGSKNYTDKKNELLNQSINRIQGREALYQDDKNPYYHAIHNVAARIVMGSDEKVKPDDVVITDKDKFGNVYFKVQADKGIKEGELKTRVEAEGGKYIKADDKFVIPGNRFGNLTNSERFSDPKIDAIRTLVDFKSSAHPNDRFNTSPQTWGNRNFQFKVDMDNGHPSYRIVDPYTGAQFGRTDGGEGFDNLEEAAGKATWLGNLNSIDYVNKVKTIGGVPDFQPK